MDEVVGVVGTVNDRGLVIAKSIVRRDLPTVKVFRGTRHHVRAAFMSDIHVGSRTFLEDKWCKVSSWIGGADEIAASIRYLVVSGDVVDGIGVYPRQDEELAIDDIYGQYEALARMIADLPDRITVVMLPGNHDAVRPAEPQPAFPTSIQHLFDSNVIFAGNPSLLSLEGVRVLAYHGRSMDDLVSAIPGMSYARPIDAMKAMLRMRHLAPIYGGKTPIAPEAEDHLIIEEVPDIFATGHVHAAGVDQYRGAVLVNSSTWQAQTPYQKMRNIEPMPARLPIVDLASGQAIVREVYAPERFIDAADARRFLRIATVRDLHGHENLPALTADLDRLGPVDLFLLAGDTTDRNDIDAFGAVVRTIRARVSAPVWAVFGNNEYAGDHPAYVARFADALGIRFLQDEAAVFESPAGRVRIIGSVGSLDRPTWWQRKNLPRAAEEYERRVKVLDGLLAGDGMQILLTHYPPTYVTMGGEKEEWRPELGSKALESVLLRRRPTLGIHGHIHKGIPAGELRPRFDRLDDFEGDAAPIPVHNVAYPVRHAGSTF